MGTTTKGVLLIVLLFLAHDVHAEKELEVSWNVMLKYLMYSMSAICTEQQGLTNWTCSWCTYFPVPPLSDITVFQTPGDDTNGIFGYVGRSNESIIIAFRGTKTFQNWITDLDYFHQDYPPVPNAFVHTGFYKSYLKVCDVILSSVIKLQSLYPNLTVISTGKSLGAALSVLTANGLIQAGVKNVQVWNFGQPRVGNDVFANYSNQVIDVMYRVVNQRDLVPHVPPQEMNFKHSSTEIWFPSNYTSYVVCDNYDGEDPKCSDSLTKYDPVDHLVYLGYGPTGLQPPNACTVF